MAIKRTEPPRPTLLDRAVGYFSPQAAMKRLVARQQYAALVGSGGYNGASRSRRQTSTWRPGGGSADADLLPDLPELRERSRDLMRNAPLARGAVNTVVTNVVGPGLKLQSQIDWEVLGLSEDEAARWERQAEREFSLWAESKDCDASRVQTFDGLQQVALRSALESGDVFAAHRFIERRSGPYALAIQMVEGDRVSNPNNQPDGSQLSNGNFISGGIEVDRNGAAVAAHILTAHPGAFRVWRNVRKWTRVPFYGDATGRRRILHIYDRLRPGQSRGEPYLAPVTETLKQLDRYSEAEIMAAVVSSFFTVFTTTEGGQGLDPTALQSETGGKASDDDLKLGAGMIIDLDHGEKVEIAKSDRPNQAFDGFVMSVLRQIGVALELPFEVLIKHFTASYSAARAAILEAWKFFRKRRAWLVVEFCQPVYEAWLYEAVARGRIVAPGFMTDPAIRKAYCGTVWTGPSQPALDPKKENEAFEIDEDRGWLTAGEITAMKNGGDWDRNITRRGAEERRRRAAGLEIPAKPGEGAAAADDAPQNPDRPEES